MTEFKHVVTQEDKDQDLDIKGIMRQHFKFSSRLRNKIKREKLIRLNGEQTPNWVKVDPGDVVSIKLPEEKSEFEAENIPIDIAYEDNDLLIINKQPYIVVHPTKGHPTGTLTNAIMYHINETNQTFKIRFMNRLDRDTSGLVAIAKNPHCQSSFMKQSQANLVEKRYVAIVKGIMPDDEGTIDLPLGRPFEDSVVRAVIPDGAPSVTHYKVLERFSKGFTMLELELETGRTHQIRVHLSHIGYPIVSDHLYGIEEHDLIGRQALHAKKLSMIHPVTNEPLSWDTDLPDDMKELIEKIR
jgi:23S rRNA pseudouridine1911/1915/1917 synthase